MNQLSTLRFCSCKPVLAALVADSDLMLAVYHFLQPGFDPGN